MRTNYHRDFTMRLVLLTLVVALLPRVTRAQTNPETGNVFDQFFRFGDTAHKVYAQEQAGETVDPFTGTLRIVQEDLFLPGKGGLDLHLVRTYSSKLWARSDLFTADPFLAEHARSVLGYGWAFHMGRLLNPYAYAPGIGCNPPEFPVFEGPDGETHVFYPVPGDASNPRFRSKDQWVLELNCPTLGGNNGGACVWSSAGIRYELSNTAGNPFSQGTRPVWPVSAIVDANGNRISMSYLGATGALDTVVDSYERRIHFSYTGDALSGEGLRLESITIDEKKCASYHYTTYSGSDTGGVGRYPLPGDRRFLTEVRFLTEAGLRVGGSHLYEYGTARTVAENQFALTKVTSPHGGTTEYTYRSDRFFTGREMVAFPVVATRTVAGRDLSAGTWTYSYSSPSAACDTPGSLSPCSKDPANPGATTKLSVTTIERPDGLVDTFSIVGFGYTIDKGASGLTYAIGQTVEAARGNRAVVEQFGWAPDEEHPISSLTTYAAPVYGATCDASHVVADPVVWAPLLKQHLILEDSATYVTEYSDFDAYGQAQTVVETGRPGVVNSTAAVPQVQPHPEIRTTTWTYFTAELENGVRLNMVRGRPLTQHVCIDLECFDNRWTYDDPGHRRDSETLSGVRTWFGHDVHGDLATVINALGEKLTLGAYDHGIPTVINLNDAYTVTREATWQGWIKSETDGRKHTTSFDYDALGRLTKVTPPGISRPTSFDYTPDGRPDGQAVRTTKGNQSVQYWELRTLDGLGRVIATADSEGVLTRTDYDVMQNVTFRSYPYELSHTGTDDPVGEHTEYDGIGRPKVILRGFRPGNATATCGDGVCPVTFEYIANCTGTTVLRALGEPPVASLHCSTSYGDPDERRLTSLGDPHGNIWRYAYSAAGKLRDVTAPMPQGNRIFLYDSNQFLRTEITPESGTVTYVRNAIGQVTSRTDARRVTTTYRRVDPLSRLTNIQWGTGDDVRQWHDNANNLQHIESRNSGVFEFGHDERNRLVSTRWTYPGARVTYDTSSQYDEMGCLRTLTYPTGTTVRMLCDSLNRPTSITIEPGDGRGVETLVSDIRYHPSGQPKHYTYANQIRTDATYDDQARLETLDARDRASQNVAGLRYSYDGAGNVLSFDNTAEANASRTMVYDGLDRVWKVVAAGQWGTTTYDYDALGNLIAKNRSSGPATTFAYDPGTNRLSYSTGPGPKAVSLTWDEPGRLATSSDAATYVYDGAGRRIQKTDASGTTVYHYDGGGRLIAETTPVGAKLRDYFYLGNRLIAVDGCITAGPPAPCTERQWYHTDALGSVLARTDVNGTVTAQFDYEPWGERWRAANLVAGADGDRQYNGRVYDAGTGFHDYGARLYWPEIGRFISADSYLGDPANPASLNRYSYVHNNPYKYVDPNGRNPIALVNFAQRAMQWCQSGGCQAAGNAALAAAASVAAWAGFEVVRAEMSRPKPGSRPKWVPTGTRPIDQTDWTDDHETIKDAVGNGPRDWTGITPEGDVITADPETGEPINHGPAKDMVPKGRPSRERPNSKTEKPGDTGGSGGGGTQGSEGGQNAATQQERKP